MAELRKDPLSGNWVIVGYDFPKNEIVGSCPFCPGNEHFTPPPIREYKDTDGNWLVRCFPATNPIFMIESAENRRAEGLYDKMGNMGAHEIIVENRMHTKTMSMFTVQEFLLLIDMYQERTSDLKRDPRLKYFQIFKNHGELAGSYIFHPHSHVLSTPTVPAGIAREVENTRAHFIKKERCLMCDIISQEIRQGKRVVAMNKNFVAFCPFASRFSYEAWIVPRFHNAYFETSREVDVKSDLAALVLDLTKRIEQLSNAYTLEIHTVPTIPEIQGEDIRADDYFHWHLEILPRNFRSSKYVRENELHVVPITPEQAAETLKLQQG